MFNTLLSIVFLFLNLSMAQAHNFYPTEDIVQFIKLSPQDQVRHLEHLNIRILKFTDSDISPNPANIIPYLHFLSLDEEKIFNRYLDTSVLGIFLTKHNSYYQVDVDTILISEQADDWTLYHELSHAIIDRKRHELQSHEEGATFMSLSDAIEDYEESMSYYRMFGKFSSNNSAMHSYESLKTWITISLDMLSTYELEEVKIEKNLEQIFKDLNLINTVKTRSARYQKYNCASAKNKFNHAKEVFIHFQSYLTEKLIKENQDDILEFKNYLKDKSDLIQATCNT